MSSATAAVGAFAVDDLMEGGFVVWYRTWRKADDLPIRAQVWARLPTSQESQALVLPAK